MTLRTFFLCGWLSVIAGCATGPFDRLRSFDGPDTGVVVASVGKKKQAKQFSSTFLQFRMRGTGDRGFLTYGPRAYLTSEGASPKDFDNGDEEGTVVVKRLPPGTYDIYLGAGVTHMGVRSVVYERPMYPPVSFTISAGEATYVGRYLVDPRRVLISSEPEADLAIAKTRTANMRWPSAVSVPEAASP